MWVCVFVCFCLFLTLLWYPLCHSQDCCANVYVILLCESVNVSVSSVYRRELQRPPLPWTKRERRGFVVNKTFALLLIVFSVSFRSVRSCASISSRLLFIPYMIVCVLVSAIFSLFTRKFFHLKFGFQFQRIQIQTQTLHNRTILHSHFSLRYADSERKRNRGVFSPVRLLFLSFFSFGCFSDCSETIYVLVDIDVVI